MRVALPFHVEFWEFDMYTIHCQWGVSLFATHRFDYDKLLLAYGIKKGSISVSIEFSGMTSEKKKMNSASNRGLRIGGAHNRSMESCAWKQFFFSDLTLNPQLKCVTKLVWIGTSAGLMTRRYFGDRRKKLIGSKEVEHFLKAQVAFLSWKLYFFRDENWTVSPESSDLHEGLSRHDFVFEVCVCVCTKHKSVCLHTSACWILFFLLLPRSCHSTGFEADL